MSYYNPDYNGIMREGWICPRCGRVNAPWVPNCTCSAVGVTYTKDTSTTAPTGKSYTINPSSYITNATIPDSERNKSTATTHKGSSEYDNFLCDVVDRDVEMLDNWLESLKRYEQYLEDDK